MRTASYVFTAEWSDEDQEYVGRCASFPTLSWLAPTAEGAKIGIQALVEETVALMVADGDVPPASG